MARRVRRRLRGGRIVNLAAGHGLLAHILLLLDDSSPGALLIDTAPPPSAARLHAVLVEAWPRLAGRLMFERRSLESVALGAGNMVASSHACGALADAGTGGGGRGEGARGGIPCCHDLAVNDSGSLSGWLDRTLAVDVMRAVRPNSGATTCGRRQSPRPSRRRSSASRRTASLNGSSYQLLLLVVHSAVESVRLAGQPSPGTAGKFGIDAVEPWHPPWSV